MENENHSNNQLGSSPRQNGVDLEDLNERHTSSIDKWYRMCAGNLPTFLLNQKRSTAAVQNASARLDVLIAVTFRDAVAWMHPERFSRTADFDWN
jgi:hypothetical protein